MQPRTGAQAGGPAAPAEVVMSSLQWRAAVGGRPDAVDRLRPRLRLHLRAVRALPAAAGRSAGAGGDGGRATARSARVPGLDVDCGPGNLTFVLAEAGFSVLGLEPYGALVELAREKRRAKRLANLAFTQGDLSSAKLRDGSFDMVVNVHTLYAHAEPAGAATPRPSCAQARGPRALREPHASRSGARHVSRDPPSRDRRGAALLLLWLLPHWLFEAARRRVGPHYWSEDDFGRNLAAAGFDGARDATDLPQRRQPAGVATKESHGVGRGAWPAPCGLHGSAGSSGVEPRGRNVVAAARRTAHRVGYGLTYDAIVRGFEPYEALLDEVTGLVARAATPGPPAATRVLDVSCGRARWPRAWLGEGWTVVGVDSVAHLVEVGRRHHSDSGLSLSFHHADAARDPIPGRRGLRRAREHAHALLASGSEGAAGRVPARARPAATPSSSPTRGPRTSWRPSRRSGGGAAGGRPGLAALAAAHRPLRALPARHPPLPRAADEFRAALRARRIRGTRTPRDVPGRDQLAGLGAAPMAAAPSRWA